MGERKREGPLSRNDYAGLVTVFAVFLVIDFAGSDYDLWDIFVGALCFVVGLKYKGDPEALKDRLYRFLTGCLLSLGVLSVASGTVGTIARLYNTPSVDEASTLELESIRFILFLFLAFAISSWLNKEMPKHTPPPM